MNDEDSRTVWVGNLDSERVTQDILYELFIQAGPLHYVKIPKDRTSGRLKNFAFICYRHDVSVPYAIELMNGIQLFNRTMKVQSRNLQHLQQQGLATGPVGVHTLNPFSLLNTNAGEPQEGCGQQSLLGPVPASHGYEQQSILSFARNITGVRGSVSSEIIEMAKQQMALLAANQPLLLTDNPVLCNAPRQWTADRYGSANYDRNYPNQRDDYYHRQHRHYENRSRDQRSLDNQSMQALKAQFDRQAEDNSKALTRIQHRHDRFDHRQQGSPMNDHRRDSDDRYHRQTKRYHNNPRHHRYNDHYDRYNEHDDRSSHYRHDPYSRRSRR